VVGLVLLIGSALAVAVPAAAADPLPSLERDLVALTNVDRTSNGLNALIEDDRLIGVARERSQDMLDRDYFSHDIPPNGEKVFAVLDRKAIPFQSAGENLAWNTAAKDATVQKAETDFMNSPAHRANILHNGFVSIGVGAQPGTSRFMYTVLFMKPFGSQAAPPAPAPSQDQPSDPPPDDTPPDE
jgi:uncharacterized protein YkwD